MASPAPSRRATYVGGYARSSRQSSSSTADAAAFTITTVATIAAFLRRGRQSAGSSLREEFSE